MRVLTLLFFVAARVDDAAGDGVEEPCVFADAGDIDAALLGDGVGSALLLEVC